jgi:hypothetical protein
MIHKSFLTTKLKPSLKILHNFLAVIDGNCHVCFGEVSGAHKCITCRRAVHVFCGVGIGEEGYGQAVKCYRCQDTGTGTAFEPKVVQTSARNTKIYKICEICRAIFSAFYNISGPNFAILLILRCSF